MDTTHKPATESIIARHEQMLKTLPFHDEQDFEDARRGFLGTVESGVIRTAEGHPVWDLDSYTFLTHDGEAPPSVNPSLWRQSRLTVINGLFEVLPGIYQVRGLDASNVTFIEGERGTIVVDPLVSKETAQAAFDLYRRHRGDRPVTAMIYTHSHIDHFGGAGAFMSMDDATSGRLPVIAPEGFAHHAVSENVFAGPAMGRRSGYMFGAALERGPQGQVGVGLAQTLSTGTIDYFPPNLSITSTGQEETIDGVRIVFQLAPDSEAPAEMHFHLPDHRALCIAENATHNLHNLLTLRGAVVRDSHAWASHLTEAIDRFGGDLEVLFASHHWPIWGRERAVEFLSLQRDLYAYLHDQTLRMLNAGLTGTEIAEAMVLPPVLENAWHARGYYGSVSHNVKAIYQRYMGWYDGNPAHLWNYPPVEAARRYVDFMGGADAVVTKARESFGAGDFRWVAEVVSHVVFAEPGHEAARELLADAFEQLGYGAENGTWRSAYLAGAHELRHGEFGTPTGPGPNVFAGLTAEQFFDALAVRVNGPRCWDERLTIDFAFTDTGVTYRVALRNGVLTYSKAPHTEPADATLRLPMSGLSGLVSRGAPPPDLRIDGDGSVLGRLVAALDSPDANFAVVTP